MDTLSGSYEDRKFEGLNFSETSLSEIELENCEFMGCSFIKVKFIKCRFINCRFSDCVISASLFTNSQLVDVHFQDSKIIGIDWTKAIKPEGLGFERCQLNYSNFKFLKLEGIKIVQCEVREADFSEANMTKADLQGSDFEGTLFFKTNLKIANFSHAKNYFVDVRTNIIKGAFFTLPEALNLLDSLEVKIVTPDLQEDTKDL